VSGSGRRQVGPRAGRIRGTDAADLAAVVALTESYFGRVGGRSLRYCRENDPQLIFCLDAAEGIVGVCFGHRGRAGDGAVILDCLAVKPSHTGRGIGTRLLAHFEEAAREADHVSVELGAEEGAPASFYRHRGYRTLAVAPACAEGHVILSKSVLPIGRPGPSDP
jgi:GNAT superfamily N-acetyltransferase